MVAFHNNPELKQVLLQQLQDSELFLEVVGVSFEKEDYLRPNHHSPVLLFQKKYNIPSELLYAANSLFHLLPEYMAQKFKVEFIEAIQVGSRFTLMWCQLATWVLDDEGWGILNKCQGEEFAGDIRNVSTMLKEGASAEEWQLAASNALDWDLPATDVAFAIANSMGFESSYANDVPICASKVVQHPGYLEAMMHEFLRILEGM